ncbi:kinase-like protein [Hanseniaspora valbyensis NRRL Y-1626]|uniref:Cyclin-dependent kinase 8 n=1 Tax=Hanseniaspora valbyensis NRRL Y-1626 TaxID=766949 RepID=A0A1B7THE3_9ASCO|nr:kinase-like protein [Hanseniaspora valbyensis NRRL Y-1626]
MNNNNSSSGRKPQSEVISIEPYKKRRDTSRVSVLDEYDILGYIAAGTYGKVYKAKKTVNSTSKDDNLEQENKIHKINFNSDEDIELDEKVSKENELKHSSSFTFDLNQIKDSVSRSEEQTNNSSGENKSVHGGINETFNSTNKNTFKNNYPKKQKRLLINEGDEDILLNINSGQEYKPDLDHNSNNDDDHDNGGASIHKVTTINDLIDAKRGEIDFLRKQENKNKEDNNTNNDDDEDESSIYQTISHTLQEKRKKYKANIIAKQNKLLKKQEEENKLNSLKPPQFYAIKKFKTEREGFEAISYIGISQSACREMALCRELNNKHLTKLVGVFLENKSIYMVSEFAEYDLLQIIHAHSHPEKKYIGSKMLKSIMWQILDGLSYLHQNWIMHRDLKPANIMVSYDGCVKIGDLGLARKFNNLIQSLYTGDKVVVTIWYRAPELLLGVRHYTPAIDLWAVGCIFAELISLRPIFKGEEAKIDNKKTVPFQTSQFKRILEILGTPNKEEWVNLEKYPEYANLARFPQYKNNLTNWYLAAKGDDKTALELLNKLLIYDPTKRIDAENALSLNYFNCEPLPSLNIFEGLNYKYPPRKIHVNDNDIIGLINSKQAKANQQQQQQQQQQQAALQSSSQKPQNGLNGHLSNVNPGMIQQKINEMSHPSQVENNLSLLTEQQKKLYLKAESDLIKAAEKKLIARGETQEAIQHHLKLIRLKVAEETRKKILTQQNINKQKHVSEISNALDFDETLPVAEQFQKLSSILRSSLYRLLSMFKIPYNTTESNPELMKKMEKLQPFRTQFTTLQMKELSVIKFCYQKERQLKQQLQNNINLQQAYRSNSNQTQQQDQTNLVSNNTNKNIDLEPLMKKPKI